MFCRKCGVQNLDSAVSCVRCGLPLAASAGPPGLPGAGDKPSNYLAPAIVSTLCCCLPFGIVSIVFASQVDSKWNAGDVAGARDAAAKAKLWFWLAFGIGLVINLLVIFVQILVAIAEQS